MQPDETAREPTELKPEGPTIQPGRTLQEPDFAALHPRYAVMRDYLARIAPPGRLPGRQNFSPTDLEPSLLPFINIAEVVRDGAALRFRYKLVGTQQTAIAAREITGRFVEEAVLPEFVDRINRNMRGVVELRRPIYDAFPMPHPERTFIQTERVYFPLASDGETVDRIVIVNGYPSMQ